MTAGEALTHLAALWSGVLALCFGLAFWIAGFANPRTSVIKQNIYAATLISAAILMLVYAFTGSLPY